jgi:hypothetical protein
MKTKQLIVTALLAVLISTVAVEIAEAQVRTTRSGYIACVSRDDFRRQTQILVSGDRQAWSRFLQNSSCFPLRAGMRVHVESAGLAVVRLRPEGSTSSFYTNIEAISR